MRQKGGREDRGHTAPTNNLDLRIKAEPVTDGADATVYICFLGQIYIYTVCTKARYS